MHENHSRHKEGPHPHRPGQITEALLAISKLIKAVRFYPPGHPTLKHISQTTLDLILPLTGGRTLTLNIRKTGFYLLDEPIGKEISALGDLAFFFFARMVHRLLFLPELTVQELEAFARCVGDEPTVLKQSGGLQELLLQNHITSLFINEIDLNTIQFGRERILVEQDASPTESTPAEQPASAIAAEPAPGVSPDLFLENLAAIALNPLELLRELAKEPSEQRYHLLCRKLVATLAECYHEPELTTPCKALLLLARHGAEKTRSNNQRRTILECLDKLGTPELLELLISALCDKSQGKATRETVTEALKALQEKAAAALVERLVREDNSQVRKLISDTLVQLGNGAIPVLIERLSDNRWYIARNALFILGRIGNRKTAIYIRPYLDHRDYRVRREAVRALSHIGGPVALKGLQHLIETRDQALCLQACFALGTLQNEAAVGPLLRLVQSFDPLLRNLELKRGAIKALGAIGSPEASPHLIKILARRRFWNREKHDKLRASAAQALGNMISDAALSALETASKDPSPLLAHAAGETLQKIVTRTKNAH